MIETTRLRGEPLQASDLHDLLPLHKDERVVRWFGGEPESDDETREFLERKLAHWAEHGFGIWMFRDTQDAFVGRCGIHRWRGEVELGYIVLPDLWGRGYATEMGTGVIAHAFETLGLEELVAFTRIDNVASRRVIEKLGFRFERRFEEAGVESVLYRLSRSPG